MSEHKNLRTETITTYRSSSTRVKISMVIEPGKLPTLRIGENRSSATTNMSVETNDIQVLIETLIQFSYIIDPQLKSQLFDSTLEIIEGIQMDDSPVTNREAWADRIMALYKAL